MSLLGVNIDHIATLRQQRREFDPDPIAAARVCEAAGADSIVCHLREDRRHIQDHDVRALRKTVKTLNLEMALSDEIIAIAGQIRPDQVTLVPEKRQELTTEGGLDVAKHFKRVRTAADYFRKRKIEVSLFINPDIRQIKKSFEAGVLIIELHTGKYAEVRTHAEALQEFKRLYDMTVYASALGMTVNAGHGLKYHNTRAVARIPGMHELNIGHSIICRAVFTGLGPAVKEMKKIVR